jgi:hypothetical protein
MEKFLTQSVVGCVKSGELLGAETPQKVPQGAAMRKVGETQDRWNQSVVDETLSVLDSAGAGHDRKEMSQKGRLDGTLWDGNWASERRAAGNGVALEICKMTEKDSVHRNELSLFSRMKNGIFWVLWAFLTILPNR